MTFTPTSHTTLRWLCVAAAVSLLTTLTLSYVGEEGVYTITALELKLNGDYFVTTLYGLGYGRPPLFAWLVVPLADALGWNHVLVATRLVTALATVATAVVTAWLAFHLTRNREIAFFSALVFLSGDTLFYRGWLAYSDPLFTFFVFTAIACLWVSTLRATGTLIWVAAVALLCAYLTKVQTAYVFYGVALIVLLAERGNRRFLLSMKSIAPHVAALVAFVVWNVYLSHGAQAGGTMSDVSGKLKTVNLADYLNQLWSFPVETFARFLPAAGVAAYYAWRTRKAPAVEVGPRFPWRTLVLILALNYLPYWLGPKTHIRYVMPLYPLGALLLAALIWRCGERARRVAVYWLAGAILLRFLMGAVLMPLYQDRHRGDYAATAKLVEQATHGFPLYAMDYSATGLSVVAHLDAARYPQPYLRWPPGDWNNGFVLAYEPDPKVGRVFASYRLGGSTLYLLCRGTACRDAPLTIDTSTPKQ
jgi:4-amino-4-deoxy-L-arabinose transferase-like glycosyltransferase